MINARLKLSYYLQLDLIASNGEIGNANNGASGKSRNELLPLALLVGTLLRVLGLLRSDPRQYLSTNIERNMEAEIDT